MRPPTTARDVRTGIILTITGIALAIGIAIGVLVARAERPHAQDVLCWSSGFETMHDHEQSTREATCRSTTNAPVHVVIVE